MGSDAGGANITIIGAGIIGLSIASELSKDYHKIFLIERHDSFGQETSSRNSEVIHSGIYYKKGSLKAKTCVEGNRLLYELCESKNIPYKKTGKIIVATNQKEVDALKILLDNGKNNGVEGLAMIDNKEVSRLEPHIESKAAIYSPQTGIVEAHSLMKYLEAISKNNGVNIVYNVNVIRLHTEGGFFKITVLDSDKEKFTFESKIVINCAGLESDTIARMAGIDIIKNKYKLYYCKGEYFRVSKKKSDLITRLIYPVPKYFSEGLGIHATLDISGSIRLGPDHEYVDRDDADYSLNPSKKSHFLDSVRKFLSFLEEVDLNPDIAGIRPRLYKENELDRDFIIKEESDNGLAGFINLIGIESPGLTSALAIAKLVKKIIEEMVS